MEMNAATALVGGEAGGGTFLLRAGMVVTNPGQLTIDRRQFALHC